MTVALGRHSSPRVVKHPYTASIIDCCDDNLIGPVRISIPDYRIVARLYDLR